MWDQVLDGVKDKIGQSRARALAMAVATRAGDVGHGRKIGEEAIDDARWLWPFVWLQKDAQGETDAFIQHTESTPRPTSTDNLEDSSGNDSSSSGIGQGSVMGCSLRCDVALFRHMLVQRFSGDASVAQQVKSQIRGDGWDVRLMTDAESLRSSTSTHATIVESEIAGIGVRSGQSTLSSISYPSSYPGSAFSAAPRLALFWERPSSLEECGKLAASLSAALVDTCSLDLIVALTAEVVAAVLSPEGLSGGGFRLHHVRGFEQAVLHAARCHNGAAAAHARRASADLPWIRRQRVRKSAKTKVKRALSRLKGLSGLLAVASGKFRLGLTQPKVAGTYSATEEGSGSGGDVDFASMGRGAAHSRADGSVMFNADRAALWAEAEAKRMEEQTRDLRSWKGKVAVEALLLALGAGLGTGTGGRDEDRGAFAVLAASLCAISGAQLWAVGAAVGLKATMLQHTLWGAVFRRVPHRLRVRVEELISMVPLDVRPRLGWKPVADEQQERREGPGGATLVGGLCEAQEEVVDALLSCVYCADVDGVKARLAAGADVFRTSSLWGSSAVHAACSLAVSSASTIARVHALRGGSCSGMNVALPESGFGEPCPALAVLRLLLYYSSMVPPEDKRDIEEWLDAHRELGRKGVGRGDRSQGPTNADAVKDVRAIQRRTGCAKIDALNVAGLPASVLVAGMLWWRVQRIIHLSVRTARRVLSAGDKLQEGPEDTEHFQDVRVVALDELLRDERAQRVEEVLELLLGAGADLAYEGARTGRGGAEGERCCAAVLQQVMSLM